MQYIKITNFNNIQQFENNLHVNLKLNPTIPLGNMSICKFDDNTYLLSIRQFNYFFDNEYTYKFINDDFYCARNNFFVLVDSNFNFIKTIDIEICNNIDFKLLEDIRILKYGNVFYLSASYPQNKVIQLCIFSMIYKNGKFITSNTFYLSRTTYNSPQKNWIPIENKPLIYIKDLKNGYLNIFDFSKHEKTINCLNMIERCGTSNLLEYKNSYIALVHKRKQFTYVYNIIVLNRDFSIAKISQNFKFFNRPVEFSCGMIIDNGQIIIPSTEDDKTTVFFKMDANYLLNDILMLNV